LAEQRRALREQLHVQRLQVVEQLVPGAGGSSQFPRSVVLRLLMQRPELLTGRNLRLALVAGAAALALLAPSLGAAAGSEAAAARRSGARGNDGGTAKPGARIQIAEGGADGVCRGAAQARPELGPGRRQELLDPGFRNHRL
jgi:hypothetical protein